MRQADSAGRYDKWFDREALRRLNNAPPGEAASFYAGLGWPVLPLAWASASRCACRAGLDCEHPAKHPLIPGGTRGASVDVTQVARWWAHWPRAGVGIVTGARSGLVVLDVDRRHGGFETVERLRAQNDWAFAPTLTAATGGGGRHLLFAHPGTPVSNAVSRLPGVGVTPGIDLRGDGGYIVAAPSGHESGARYRWLEGVTRLAAFPRWIVEPSSPSARKDPGHPVPPVARSLGFAPAALAGEVRRVAAAEEGVRNDTLNRAAFALGTLVGAGALDHDHVRAALAQAAAGVGISSREATRTIASGLNAGIARPRQFGPSPPERAHASRYQPRRSPKSRGPRL
jgi:hypothetical protein